MTSTYTSGEILTADDVNGELAFPTGLVLPYAGSSAPGITHGGVAAWLLCDGSAVSRTTYAALFALVSTTYGAGNGSTTFNVPDLRGRIPMGDGTGARMGETGTGAISGGTALTARAVGEWGGDERLQAHTHALTDPGHYHSAISTAGSGGGPGVANWTVGGASAANATTFAITGAIGTGATVGAHNLGQGAGLNVQPMLVLKFIVKT